jgi:hypothetical protein
MISGLYAIDALLARGLFQEQGVIQRVVDELGEDISFLSQGIIFNDVTPLHKEYLDFFYEEEFGDPSDIFGSHKSRGMVRRDKIRAYINRRLGPEFAAASANVAEKIIAKAYSGFVHAASPHIMDMCVGAPPRFDINGTFRELRMASYVRDASNYFLRGLMTSAVAAKAFNDEALFSDLRTAAANLETEILNLRPPKTA